MKPIFVSDNYTIINTQGVRFIEKINGNRYGTSTTEWSLVVTYKKERLVYYYQSENLRDMQYQRLRDVVEKEYGVKK